MANVGKTQSPYEVLGVRKDADHETVEAAYSVQREKYRGNPQAQEQLVSAYQQILRNQQQKLPGIITFDCQLCGYPVEAPTEKVLQIGTENLVCSKCSGSRKESKGFLKGLWDGDYDFELLTCVFLLIFLPSVISFGITLEIIVGAIVLAIAIILLYYAHTEHSWLCAIIGFTATHRALGLLYGFLTI